MSQLSSQCEKTSNLGLHASTCAVWHTSIFRTLSMREPVSSTARPKCPSDNYAKTDSYPTPWQSVPTAHLTQLSPQAYNHTSPKAHLTFIPMSLRYPHLLQAAPLVVQLDCLQCLTLQDAPLVVQLERLQNQCPVITPSTLTHQFANLGKPYVQTTYLQAVPLVVQLGALQNKLTH